jgi:hypothetical protein
MRMKTAHERQEEQRQAKLKLMRQQIKAGKLVVRQMTDEERKKYPPGPEKPKRRYTGRSS